MPAQFGGNGSSGRATSIAVDPTNPSVMYLGTSGGGVWKTADGGQNWSPLTDDLPSLATGTVVLDPTDHNVVYLGTGECTGYGDAYPGAGLFRSIDAGVTWSAIGSFPFTADQFVNGPRVCSVLITPTDNKRILVGTDSGIYLSADGGTTWSATFTNGPNAVVRQLQFDPTNPKVVYATINAVGQVGNVKAGVWKSTDAGATWALLTGSLTSSTSSHLMLAIDPSNPSTVYFREMNCGTSQCQVLAYKSGDRGGTWASLASVPNTGDTGGGGVIAVSPKNPNELYLADVTIYQSTDDGSSWRDVNTDSTGHLMHPDTQAIAFSPDGGTMYVLGDGGVYSTSTIDSANFVWNDLNATIQTINFYPGMGLDQSSGTTLIGSQDEGTLEYSGNREWKNVLCGDGGYSVFDYTDAQVIYANCNQGSTGTVFRSLDGGTTWSSASSGLPTTGGPLFLPIVINPTSHLTLYVAGSDNLIYRSTDGANSWTAISQLSSAWGSAGHGSPIYAIAVAPSDANTIYAGNFTGNILVTADAGTSAMPQWNSASVGLPTLSVAQIAVDPSSSKLAYVAFSGYGGDHVFRTVDGGQSWSDISAGLPDAPVSALIIDPGLFNTLYVGTDVGVFATRDGGQSWILPGTGLPNVVVTTLGFYQATRTLRAGTHGRGAWDLGLPAPAEWAVSASPSTLTFPATVVSKSSSALPVAVSNNVRASATPISVSISGDFTESDNCGASLAAGATCPIQVTFVPTAVGPRTGSLSVAYGAYTEVVNLSGTATFSVTVSASGSTATVGNAVTLTWTAASGATCTASGGGDGDGWAGSRTASGSTNVTESSAGTYNYTLACTLSGQSQQAQATVTFAAGSSSSSSAGASGRSGGGGFGLLSLVALGLLVGLKYARDLRGDFGRLREAPPG